jgi:hypothetical protein
VLAGSIISSKMDGVERASDFVLREDVRSCAIDYAIGRARQDVSGLFDSEKKL